MASLDQGVFVTGIDTGIGKTVVSAVLTKMLSATYWKPVQAGDLSTSDTITVGQLTGECPTSPEAFQLQTPASPHYAAAIDGVSITVQDIAVPKTRPLVAEGAGGVLVPLNDRETILDLMIKVGLPVVVASRHYLGSINHTLLTLQAIRQRGLTVAGIVFLGPPTPPTEEVIALQGKAPIWGRLPWLANPPTADDISQWADDLKGGVFGNASDHR